MHAGSEYSVAKCYLLWVLALSLIRILVVAASPYGLYLEEPYYWAWAQQPDWGYYSKPPLVAWLIVINYQLFGATAAASQLLPLPLTMDAPLATTAAWQTRAKNDEYITTTAPPVTP